MCLARVGHGVHLIRQNRWYAGRGQWLLPAQGTQPGTTRALGHNARAVTIDACQPVVPLRGTAPPTAAVTAAHRTTASTSTSTTTSTGGTRGGHDDAHLQAAEPRILRT